MLLAEFGAQTVGTPLTGVLIDLWEPQIGKSAAMTRAITIVWAPCSIIGLILMFVAVRTIDFASSVVTQDMQQYAGEPAGRGGAPARALL